MLYGAPFPLRHSPIRPLKSSLALIWAVTAATTLLQAGNGLLQVLMPLRMQAEGFSVSAIGVVLRHRVPRPILPE